VKHFARSGAVFTDAYEDEIDLEQLEIEARKPQMFDVTTEQLILLSFEQASATSVTLNDMCWICQLNWSEFVELRLVTILPCSHSACSACLFKLFKTCNQKQNDERGEYSYQFNCGICRLDLDETIPFEAADKVLDRNLVPSFFQFILTGPDRDERTKRRQLVYSLLVDHFEYEVNRVEATLFNLIDIMGVDESEKLSSGLKILC
jgi:hypothetical protein